MEDSQDRPSLAPIGPGSVLDGRYRLGRLIGRGGAAEVFAARDERLGREVAVKLFRFGAAGLADARRQQAEMQVLARLNHPGLIAIYDAGLSTDRSAEFGQQYLVMELVSGRSLAQRLVDGPLTARQTAELGGQLAEALAYIHGMRVVHRDVKPANVMLATPPAMVAKLTDFGIARAIGDAQLTGEGLTIGTAHYLSPEQALGQPVGPASDIYSLGLLLLECRTGQPAFPGPAIESAMARLHRDPEVPAALGADFGLLVTAMTAQQPDRRPTADKVAAALHQLATTEARPDIGLPTALLPPVRPAKRHRALLLRRSSMLAGGAVAAVLAAVWVGAQSGHAPDRAGTPGPTDTPISSGPVTSRSSAAVPARRTSAAVTRSAVTRSAVASTSHAPRPPAGKPKKSHGKH